MTSDDPDCAKWLNGLGYKMSTRFCQTGNMEDLENAVELSQMAVDATPDHAERSSWLKSLGNYLGDLFRHTGRTELLHRAIEAAELSLIETLPEHYYRATRLQNLGQKLELRLNRTGNTEDLNRAIELTDMAATTNIKPPDQASMLNIIARAYGARFEYAGLTDDDIDQAVKTIKQAVALTPAGHPERATHLTNLGTG